VRQAAAFNRKIEDRKMGRSRAEASGELRARRSATNLLT
jgi:hypothetical protein